MNIPIDIMKEYKELKASILEHNRLYYTEDDPIISDQEYDALYSRLIEIEKQYPFIVKKDSPSQLVGGKAKKDFKTIKHLIPMLSLQNAFTNKDIDKFHKRISKIIDNPKYTTEFKYDGVSLSLIYDKGKLIQAITRGDGIKGEDVTANAYAISNIPKIIPDNSYIVVRGEVIISKMDFVNINNERTKVGLKPFISPRNAAAGSLRVLDPNVTAQRSLIFIPYQAYMHNDKEINTYEEMYIFLCKLGFPTINTNIHHLTIDEVKDKYENHYRQVRNTSFYETDGIVIKLDSFKDQDILGNNNKYPKHSIAYKFEVATKITTIQEIELSIGRSGAITPVAIIDPVELDGATISRCTLHNFDEIKRLGIYEKAKVFIKRSGGVIPKITKVATITKYEPYVPPTNCPICDTELIYIDSTLHCPNVLCKGQLKKRIEFMVSREVLDIDGLGSKIIDQLIDKNIVNDLPDIFTLTKEDLISLDRVGDKLASNIIANIEDALPVSFSEFITILCIPKVSVRTAQLLADNYRNIYKLIDDLNDGTFQVNGIGEVVTDSLKKYLNKNKDIIIKFEKVGISYNS